MRAKYVRLFIGLVALIIATGVVWFSLGWAGEFAFRRGLQAKREWKLAEAVNYFTWAHRLQRSNSLAILELGICEQLRGDFLASQRRLGQLSKTKIGDPVTLSRLHNSIGINQHNSAEPDAAVASHELALTHARTAGNRGLEAAALIELSRALYYSKGRFNDAVANLEKAHSIGKDISDERIQAGALRHLGVVYWWFKGELDRPLTEFYFPALELFRRQNDQRGAATMLTLIALVFNNKGDIYRLMQYQTQGIEIQQRIGDQAGLADSYLTMGQLYDGAGNYRKAHEFYRQALEITRRNGYRLLQNHLEALLAQLSMNLDDYDEAIKLYDPFSRHLLADAVDFNVGGVAYAYQLKGNYDQALSLYQRLFRAYRQGTTPDVRLEANVLMRSAECSIGLNDWNRARDFAARADEVFRTLETHGGEIDPAIVRAKLAQHEGNHQQALVHLQAALDTEARIFASASTNSLIPPHRRSYDNLYELLAGYATANTDTAISRRAAEILFAFLENMRYRSLRNFLIQVKEKRANARRNMDRERELTEQIARLSRRLKQLDDALTRQQLRKVYDEYENLTLKAQLEAPQFLAIRQAMPAPLSEVQSALSPQIVLLEFLFVRDKVYALVLSRDVLRVIALPVSKSALAAKTKLFRALVFSKETDSDYLPVAVSLHASVIDPILASGALSNTKSIGVVPYGFLHDLPFAALARTESGRPKFLIEDYSLFRVPSATSYVHKLTSSARQQAKTLAFGRNSSKERNLPDLAFAAEEARAVAQTTGGTALVNHQATETELKRLVYDVDYLHLSTHGVAESDMPLFSRVLLEPTATDDGNLTVREIFELGLQTELVTLSACETGQSFSASGTDLVEQDRIGLIEAFLHAGSRGVVATLLPVSDRPTMTFMDYFYGQLAAGKPGSTALSNTQRAMLRGDISPTSYESSTQPHSYRHPRYWAPFILVGNSL